MSTYYLDITREHCPMTFVKTKLKLEELAANDVLEVMLTEGEPLQNLPRTVAEAGYHVVEIKPHGSNYTMVIRVPSEL